MSKLEQFGLATGIIGLISDAIALVTFVLGFWTLQSTDNGIRSMSTLFIVVTAFFIFYGWFMVSWVLVRRRIVLRRDKEFITLRLVITSTVPTLGFLISPIFVFWLFSVASTPLTNSLKKEEAAAAQKSF